MNNCNPNNSEESKEFYCNISLIKALIQFLPLSDRKKIQVWMTKLLEVDDNSTDFKIRIEYSLYLLMNMQNGTLLQPFNKPPTPGKLKPLCRILPDFLYEDVQKQLKVSFCRLNKMLNATTENYELPDLSCEPPYFFGEQPRPRKGITASFAVFSNFEEGGH